MMRLRRLESCDGSSDGSVRVRVRVRVRDVVNRLVIVLAGNVG